MQIKSIQEIVACDDCGALLHHSRTQEVISIMREDNPKRPGRYSTNTYVRHYCREHMKPYTQVTNTSGYERYYTGPGKEVFPYGQPIIPRL